MTYVCFSVHITTTFIVTVITVELVVLKLLVVKLTTLTTYQEVRNEVN